MFEKKSLDEEVEKEYNPMSAKTGNDTIYLCNFRVSVDGEWLCLRELQDVGGVEKMGVKERGVSPIEEAGQMEHFPEHEQLIHYPNYPFGKPGISGRSMAKILDTYAYG